MAEAESTLQVLCGPLEIGSWAEFGPDILVLAMAAKGPAERHRRILSQVSDREVCFEMEAERLAAQAAERNRDLKRLEIDVDGDAPRSWRPRKVRRRATKPPARERETAECRRGRPW